MGESFPSICLCISAEISKSPDLLEAECRIAGMSQVCPGGAAGPGVSSEQGFPQCSAATHRIIGEAQPRVSSLLALNQQGGGEGGEVPPERAQKGEAQRRAEQLLTELHASVSFRFENGQLVGVAHPVVINEAVLLLLFLRAWKSWKDWLRK